jgi:prevent-host-death family protein
MKISVTAAKSKLAELVMRAQAGAEVVLTRDGQPVVRLVPVRAPSGRQTRRKLLEAVRSSGGQGDSGTERGAEPGFSL